MSLELGEARKRKDGALNLGRGEGMGDQEESLWPPSDGYWLHTPVRSCPGPLVCSGYPGEWVDAVLIGQQKWRKG